jgi:hypothetical protein
MKRNSKYQVGGESVIVHGPTDIIKKGNKTTKVKRSDAVGTFTEKSISNPVEFLNSYYESNEFKRKSGSAYDANIIYTRNAAKLHSVDTVDSDPNGSWAVPTEVLLESKGFGKDKKPTITLDKSQANKNKWDLVNEVLPHEYGHATRRLWSDEERKFVEKNRNGAPLTFYNYYKDDKEGLSSGKSFSQWYTPIAEHKYVPSENNADINALRWLMYKNGIYDVRKGQLTPEQLKKASEHPNIKDSFIYKRLMEAFTPENLIDLNNTIAYNNNDNDNPQIAKYGGEMKKKSKYYAYQTGGSSVDPAKKPFVVPVPINYSNFSTGDFESNGQLTRLPLSQFKANTANNFNTGDFQFKSNLQQVPLTPNSNINRIPLQPNPTNFNTGDFQFTGGITQVPLNQSNKYQVGGSRPSPYPYNQSNTFATNGQEDAEILRQNSLMGQSPSANPDYQEEIPLQQSNDIPWVDAFNGTAGLITNIANSVNNRKENQLERDQYLKAITPAYTEDADRYGLNKNPIFTKYGGKTSKYQMGGVTPVQTTPIAPQAKTISRTQQIRDKYKNNPFVSGGREGWYAALDKEFPISGGKVKDAVYNAAKQSGVNPGILFGSAMEEGLELGIYKPDNASGAFVDWSKKNPKVAEQFPVDGFYNYGLDRFSEQYKDLQKKGYLPEGFDKRFTPMNAINEKKENIKTAAFASDQDALMAKAAVIRDTRDQLTDYEKANGITLSDKQRDFFTLAGYNAGTGNMQSMIKSYKDKGYLKDDKFLEPSFAPASYSGVYKNVQRRLQNANVLQNEGFFSDFSTDNNSAPVTSNTNKTAKSMQVGGEIPSTYGVNNNQGGDVNVEAERGEAYMDFMGNVGQVAEDAATHEQGGVMLPDVHKVLENTSNMRKDKNSKFLKLEPKQFKSLTGLDTTKSMSHAEAMVKANDAYEDQRKFIVKKVELATKDKDDMDKYAENSVKLNLDHFKSIPTQQELFDRLFNHQEYVKAVTNIPSPEEAKMGKQYSYKNGGLSRDEDYGSEKKPYPSVKSNDFAGGDRSYPIPTKADAIDALRLAGLHGRSDVRAKVYAKYPELKKSQYGGSTKYQVGGVTPYPGNKSGMTTPAGNYDAFPTGMSVAEYIASLKAKGMDVSNIKNNADLQKASYDFVLKNNPQKVKAMWQQGMHQKGMKEAQKRGFVDAKGNFKPGVLDNMDNLKSLGDLYDDSLLGIRLLSPQSVATPWTDANIPQEGSPEVPQQDLDPTIKSNLVKVQGKQSEFNEPLRWYDVASPINAYSSALNREPEKYNPAEINQLKYKLLDPTASLQANQSDFNATVQAVQNTSPGNIGAQMANIANIAASKYSLNNQVLGNFENQNAQIKNQEILYNTQAKDKQSFSDQQSREVFEDKVLTSKAKQQEQKLTALDTLYKTIAENRALNRNGNLMMKFSRAFDQYGNYNGYQPLFGVNPQSGVPNTSNYSLPKGKTEAAGGVQGLQQGKSYYNRKTGKTLFFDGTNLIQR